MQMVVVERLKGEPELAWEAFRVFMSIPFQERTIEQLVKRLDVAVLRPAQIGRWAARFSWNERSLALARQAEELEMMERTRQLERQADELRSILLEPYLRARKRYENLVENGVEDTQAYIDTLAQILASAPLAEEALMLCGHSEIAAKHRAEREAACRDSFLGNLAGPGPSDGPSAN